MMLILGGTSDALEIANKMYKHSDKIIYSTATEYGFQVSDKKISAKVIQGRLDSEQLKGFCANNSVCTILDATHPYAELASTNAMKVCNELNLSYIRYERKSTELFGQNVLICDNYEEAGRLAEGLSGIIFITTGSKNVDKILNQISDNSRVRVRVLPMSSSIKSLEDLRLNSDNIIAMKGPFTEDMNYIMLKESKACVLICKDSGKRGGTKEKLKTAKKLGIITILIKRPKLDYIKVFDDIDAIVACANGFLE